MFVSRPSDTVFKFLFRGGLFDKLHFGVVFSFPAGSVPLRTECGPRHAGVPPGPADHEHAAPDPLAGKGTLACLILRAFVPRLGCLSVCPRASRPVLWNACLTELEARSERQILIEFFTLYPASI